MYCYYKNLYFVDALLSDLSYSQSEDSSYDNLNEKSKPIYAQIKKTNNVPNGGAVNKKTCEVILKKLLFQYYYQPLNIAFITKLLQQLTLFYDFHNDFVQILQIKNININGGEHIIATTTLTMNLGHVNAKSIIKTHQRQIPEVLSLHGNHFFG